MMQWIKVPEARFDEMLGCLPPAAYSRSFHGFLVGEPNDHVMCSVYQCMMPNYQPFAEISGTFYEACGCLTLPEFLKLTAPDVLNNIKEIA